MSTKRSLCLVSLPLILVAAAALAQTPTARRSAFVRVEATADLAAAPSKVWAALASPSGLATLGGLELQTSDAKLAKVGDFATAKVWTDTGTVVVTGMVAGKELRLVYEPENASYICHLRLRLEAVGTGSRLVVTEGYSDDQLDKVDETAQQVVSEVQQHLDQFKSTVEGR